MDDAVQIPLYRATCRGGPFTYDYEVVAFATIDAADAPAVLEHRWFLFRGYARRKMRRTSITLAAFLMGEPPEGCVWGHANGDELDCRRANLRPAARSQSRKTGYRGVHVKGPGRVEARVRNVYLGTGTRRHTPTTSPPSPYMASTPGSNGVVMLNNNSTSAS